MKKNFFAKKSKKQKTWKEQKAAYRKGLANFLGFKPRESIVKKWAKGMKKAQKKKGEVYRRSSGGLKMVSLRKALLGCSAILYGAGTVIGIGISWIVELIKGEWLLLESIMAGWGVVLIFYGLWLIKLIKEEIEG